MKTVGGLRRTRYRGVDCTGLTGYLAVTAYNLVRMANLMAVPEAEPVPPGWHTEHSTRPKRVPPGLQGPPNPHVGNRVGGQGLSDHRNTASAARVVSDDIPNLILRQPAKGHIRLMEPPTHPVHWSRGPHGIAPWLCGSPCPADRNGPHATPPPRRHPDHPPPWPTLVWNPQATHKYVSATVGGSCGRGRPGCMFVKYAPSSPCPAPRPWGPASVPGRARRAPAGCGAFRPSASGSGRVPPP